MSRKVLPVLVLGMALLTLPMYSQWAKVYGKEGLNFETSSVLNAHRGGYLAGGIYTDRSNGYSGWAGWIMKVSIRGDLEWMRHYSPVLALTPTSDQGYVAAGFDTIFKIDRFGTLIWHKTVKIDRFESCQQTQDGGFITIGRMYRRDVGGGYCLIKFSDIGDIEWKRMFAINDLHYENLRIFETSDGGFFAAGNTKFPRPYPIGFWIMKISPQGRIRWQKRFGGMESCLVNDFVITSQGDYVLLGLCEHVIYDVFDVFIDSNIWIMKIRPDGEIIWQKEYGQIGGTGGEIGYSLFNAQDSGFLISGMSYYETDREFMILKLKSDGAIRWYKTFGGANSIPATDVETRAYSACQARGGRYVILGSTDTLGMVWHTPDSPRENSIVLLKLKKNGGYPGCPLLGNGPFQPVVHTSYPLIDFRYGFRDVFLKAKDSELIVKDLDVTQVDDVCSWIHQE